MKKPSFKAALDAKPPRPQSLEEAAVTIRILNETIVTLTAQARQLEAKQRAGAHARPLKKIRAKK
jgi:hypothetical protein